MKRLGWLSRSEVRRVQSHLKQLGFYEGAVDGLIGPLTRSALRKWKVAQASAISPDVLSDIDLTLMNPTPPKVRGMEEFKQVFGDFEYEDLEGGAVRVLGDWEMENLVPAHFPWFGFLVVHKLVYGSLMEIGTQLERTLPHYQVELVGAYNPRHKMHDPKRGLSLHSWGVAVDIDWHLNPYGSTGKLPPEVVRVFEQAGWVWGGRWGTLVWDRKLGEWKAEDPQRLKYSDPMHFQAVDV